MDRQLFKTGNNAIHTIFIQFTISQLAYNIEKRLEILKINKAVLVAAILVGVLGHLRDLNKNFHARVTRRRDMLKRLGTSLLPNDKVYCRRQSLYQNAKYLISHFICRMISFEAIQNSEY
jgi:hypothetical protein